MVLRSAAPHRRRTRLVQPHLVPAVLTALEIRGLTSPARLFCLGTNRVPGSCTATSPCQSANSAGLVGCRAIQTRQKHSFLVCSKFVRARDQPCPTTCEYTHRSDSLPRRTAAGQTQSPQPPGKPGEEAMTHVTDACHQETADAQLMQRFYEGDARTFDALVQRLAASLFGQAYTQLPTCLIGRAPDCRRPRTADVHEGRHHAQTDRRRSGTHKGGGPHLAGTIPPQRLDRLSVREAHGSARRRPLAISDAKTTTGTRNLPKADWSIIACNRKWRRSRPRHTGKCSLRLSADFRRKLARSST